MTGSSSLLPPILRRGAAVAAGLVLATAGLTTLAAPATAQTPLTLYVAFNGSDRFNNCEDQATPCRTLGQAIAIARFDPDSEIAVSVAGGATYDGEDTIDLFEGRSLTIEPAPGTGPVTVTGIGRGGSVFTVEQGDVVLRGLTIVHGRALRSGGGVEVAGGTVLLADDTIADNSATLDGGGVHIGNAGVVTLTDDTVRDNVARVGGGVLNAGTATLTDDTVHGNTADSLYGGGLDNLRTATLQNVTFTGDHAVLGGSGVYNGPGATMQLTGVTVWDEQLRPGLVPGGALTNQGAPGSMRLAGSIVAEPADYPVPACAGPISAPVGSESGHDVVTDRSCATGPDDVVSTAPQINLRPLADNGSTGPQTLALMLPSSAYRVVPLASGFCLSTDERGLPRPGRPGDACDAGAFEVQGVAVVPPPCGCAPTAAYLRPRLTAAQKPVR